MKRIIACVGVTSVAAAMLPALFTASPAHAEYSGFAASATARPVYMEIYEPVIPLPASPQAELNLGYATAKADSGTSRGRATYIWPGDVVGDGAKTILENLGLPAAISGPIAAQGYPFKVTADYPTGPLTDQYTPAPGTVMRAEAGPETTYAQNGFSTDCDITNSEGSPGVALPELPDLGGLLGGLLGDGTGGTSDGSTCSIPAELAAVVDLGGFNSQAVINNADGLVQSVASTDIGDVKLLGGLVTMSGMKSTTTTSSDGVDPQGENKVHYGTINIAGNPYAFGPDGFEATGETTAVPGLSDNPAKALKQLGISLKFPKPTVTKDGTHVFTEASIVEVTLDTAPLKPVISQLDLSALAPLFDQFPPDAAPLTSLLGALNQLSPKIVITMGKVISDVDTVPPIDPPTTPPTTTPTDTNTDNGGTGITDIPTLPPVEPVDPGTEVPQATEPVASILPPLFSIPGMLLLLALAGGLLAGYAIRRLGWAALGIGNGCTQGLNTGLPDLRKV